MSGGQKFELSLDVDARLTRSVADAVRKGFEVGTAEGIKVLSGGRQLGLSGTTYGPGGQILPGMMPSSVGMLQGYRPPQGPGFPFLHAPVAAQTVPYNNPYPYLPNPRGAGMGGGYHNIHLGSPMPGQGGMSYGFQPPPNPSAGASGGSGPPGAVPSGPPGGSTPSSFWGSIRDWWNKPWTPPWRSSGKNTPIPNLSDPGSSDAERNRRSTFFGFQTGAMISDAMTGWAMGNDTSTKLRLAIRGGANNAAAMLSSLGSTAGIVGALSVGMVEIAASMMDTRMEAQKWLEAQNRIAESQARSVGLADRLRALTRAEEEGGASSKAASDPGGADLAATALAVARRKKYEGRGKELFDAAVASRTSDDPGLKSLLSEKARLDKSFEKYLGEAATERHAARVRSTRKGPAGSLSDPTGGVAPRKGIADIKTAMDKVRDALTTGDESELTGPEMKLAEIERRRMAVAGDLASRRAGISREAEADIRSFFAGGGTPETLKGIMDPGSMDSEEFEALKAVNTKRLAAEFMSKVRRGPGAGRRRFAGDEFDEFSEVIELSGITEREMRGATRGGSSSIAAVVDKLERLIAKIDEATGIDGTKERERMFLELLHYYMESKGVVVPGIE